MNLQVDSSSTPITPLQEYLNAIGLPWQSSRASLQERFGIRLHPAYNWEIIEIDTPRPFVRGLLWPLSTAILPQFSPRMPAIEYSGASYFTEDARDNLHLTRAQLMPLLGEGKPTQTSNSLGHEWRFGPASVELHVWPPEMQRFFGANPSHSREPRLKVACSIGVKTGYRPVCSTKEKELIESFVPVARIPSDPSATNHVQHRPALQSELEFIRLLDSKEKSKYGRIGLSADHSALIFFGPELYCVPMTDIVQFEVERVQPAKGPGGSWLRLRCRCNEEVESTKTLTICCATGPDDLSALCADIARATGKPFVLLPYGADY
ncbi:hypothetical protein [Paraburkholderia ferrariae]|uniref:Uncharacterized protein n=1 Tax=Paraburkholderia ferrariae TaxID=386056 RepID=A0ABU9RMG4_9BURK